MGRGTGGTGSTGSTGGAGGAGGAGTGAGIPGWPTIELRLGDITHDDSDAIVSSVCPTLLGGGQIDRTVRRRGGPIIDSQLARIREERFADGLPVAGCVATSGGRLDCHWVIHAAGPVWSPDGAARTWARVALRATFDNAFLTAAELGAMSLAVPALCVGACGYPLVEAAEIAVGAARAAGGRLRRIRFVVSNRMAFLAYVQAFADSELSV